MGCLALPVYLAVLFAVMWGFTSVILVILGVEDVPGWATPLSGLFTAFVVFIAAAQAVGSYKTQMEEKASWTTCRYCKEEINHEATVCAHCGRDV